MEGDVDQAGQKIQVLMIPDMIKTAHSQMQSIRVKSTKGCLVKWTNY